MDEKKDFALVSRPRSVLEKTKPGTKRILLGMVTDTLALANRDSLASAGPKFVIGESEWCEPDYQQVLLWAKNLQIAPEEVIVRLQRGRERLVGSWARTVFEAGHIKELHFDFEQLPLSRLDWVEGLQITRLWFSNAERTSFPKVLKTLSLPLTWLPHLSCAKMGLAELELSNLRELEFLSCGSNSLERLNIHVLRSLTSLRCVANRLTDLDFSGNTQLRELSVHGNQITKLDVNGLNHLTKLMCGYNRLRELNLSHLIQLRTLDCGRNSLEKLDVSANPSLEWLRCHKNQIKELDLSRQSQLRKLECSGNHLQTLDIRNLPIRHQHWFRDLIYDVDKTRLIQRPDQNF